MHRYSLSGLQSKNGGHPDRKREENHRGSLPKMLKGIYFTFHLATCYLIHHDIKSSSNCWEFVLCLFYDVVNKVVNQLSFMWQLHLIVILWSWDAPRLSCVRWASVLLWINNAFPGEGPVLFTNSGSLRCLLALKKKAAKCKVTFPRILCKAMVIFSHYWFPKIRYTPPVTFSLKSLLINFMKNVLYPIWKSARWRFKKLCLGSVKSFCDWLVMTDMGIVLRECTWPISSIQIDGYFSSYLTLMRVPLALLYIPCIFTLTSSL